MKQCDICKRQTNRTYNLQGYCLCAKHMHQLYKYGKFLDNIQRANNDLNDYIIKDNSVIFNIYNQKNIKIEEFIIDLEDIEKVKYHKWRLSHNHVVTGLPAQGTQRDLSHVIMDFVASNNPGMVVDHIDGNPLNNKKNNLRITTQSNNVLNRSFMSNNTSGFIGISYRKDRDRYDPEIRFNSKRCHLGYEKDKAKAVYKRYYAEKILFKDYANENEQKKKLDFCKSLSELEKKELEDVVKSKLKAKDLWR